MAREKYDYDPIYEAALRNDIEAVRKQMDDEAFRRLFQEAGLLIRHYRYYFYHREWEKEEFLQEAALSLFRAIMTYDLSQEEVPFLGYFSQVFKNRLMDCLRYHQAEVRRKKDNVYLAEASAGYAYENYQAGLSGPGSPEYYLQLKDQLQAFFASLSSLERAVSRLAMRGYSFEEMALELGRSEASVRSAYNRAKGKLLLMRDKRTDGPS